MKSVWVIAMGIGVTFVSGLCLCEEPPVQLPEVLVEGPFQEEEFFGPLFTETDTKTKITETGIHTLGPAATMSVPRAINLIPSVNQQSVDPTGLSDSSNYHEAFRFRGVEPTGGGNPSTAINVENLPVSGRPGGGAAIYDLENFSSISIYKGGLPADKGLGLTDIGGKIDMEVRRPEKAFGFDFTQSLGSYGFRKTFMRLDAGALPSDTAGFLSFSNTAANKWKGEGDANRDNAMVGLTQQIGDGLKVEAFSIYNDVELNPYRPMTYQQASSLGTNDKLDYSDKVSDYYYYNYNKNNFSDFNIFANIQYDFNTSSRVTVKPFYWNDNGYYLETVTMKEGGNRIRRWDMDHDLSGVMAQYSFKSQNAGVDIGYSYLEQERPGPPTSWKLYKVSSGSLVFDKWQLLSNASSHRQHAPFVTGSYKVGGFNLEGGLKYLQYSMPDIITYNTTGIQDVSYSSALAMATSIESGASAAAKDFNELLPNAGASYALSESLSCYCSYGRNYGMSVALYPYFVSQKSTFYSKGITFQDLWNEQKLEIADNVDLGIRYITEKLYVVPTIYYADHKNKSATYYDSSLNVTFPSSIFNAKAYGFEIEAGAMPFKNLSLYASFSYNRFYFTENINNQAGTVIPVKGNQVPDAPEFLVKAMASYRIGELTLSPIVRFTSDRYGDILQSEKIDGAALFDFIIAFRTALPSVKVRNFELSLAFSNIFNKEYISIINTTDYSTLGSTYQAGAPFTVYGSASISF